MTLEGKQSTTSRCPNCGNAVQLPARFCSHCGAALDEAGQKREERKLVSVLFVDLVGFTARSDRADPEDVRDTLHLYHAEAKRRIEHYGGLLEKFIGDAVMAVFGAPVAHGDDAERAVRAGLSVLSAIDELDIGLAARAAVNTGEAVVSLDSSRGEALATGDVVNTASRLQTAAPTGRLLVGAETYRATRDVIRYEPSEPVDAKGKQERLDAWIAVSPLTEPAERPGRNTPLVGRSREVELMRSVWRRCVDERRPHLVTVVGPPGIGKSRLCREFTAQATADRGRILRGRCLPYEEQVGYQAFSRLVHAATGILESDEPDEARRKLEAAVGRLMPPDEAAEAFSYVALLLGLAPGAEVPNMQLLFFAARRLMECVGNEQPTVFVFEDIHWAQSSEIALLEYLANHLRDSPVMLVAAARPELLDTHPSWGTGLTAQTTIPLDPLTPQDSAALAAELLAPEIAASLDVGRIVETAGGNPLFLEELAASVAELDVREDLPVTVREAIAARIDALPADARAALLSAAVVGRTFWRGVVAAVDGVSNIDQALAVLEARDFIRHDPSSQLGGDVQYTFRHTLIRDVAYGTVPRAVRKERHASVARFIEDRLAGAVETMPTILAHHWRAAGDPVRAISYLVAAADAARRSWAQDAVIDLYSTAVELAQNDEQRRELELQRALALVELDQYERAVGELEAVLPGLEGQKKLDALIALGHALLWTERDEETIATARGARELLEIVDDPTAVPAVLAMESQGLAMRGGEGDIARALELGDEALATWTPGARPFDLVQHLHLHADLTYWLGQYERSVELSRRTRALASEEHVAEQLLRGGAFEALALAELGRHEEAIRIFDEMLAVAEDLGQNPRTVFNYSSLAYRELGDIAEARRRTEIALELSAALTFGMPKQFAGSDMIFTHLLEGDVGAAQAAWPKRWDDARHATAWTTWLIAGRLAAARAEIALHADSAELAVEWAQRSLQIARRTKRRKYEARSLTLLGQAFARQQRREEALRALRAAVPIADDLVGPPARWQARAALGEAAYALGDDATADEAFAGAVELVESFAATLAPDRAAKLLASGPVSELLARVGRSAAV
jgi:class 3 adenylate cyclase/tetratricopeptide (TPR) repeat protein